MTGITALKASNAEDAKGRGGNAAERRRALSIGSGYFETHSRNPQRTSATPALKKIKRRGRGKDGENGENGENGERALTPAHEQEVAPFVAGLAHVGILGRLVGVEDHRAAHLAEHLGPVDDAGIRLLLTEILVIQNFHAAPRLP